MPRVTYEQKLKEFCQQGPFRYFTLTKHYTTEPDPLHPDGKGVVGESASDGKTPLVCDACGSKKVYMLNAITNGQQVFLIGYTCVQELKKMGVINGRTILHATVPYDRICEEYLHRGPLEGYMPGECWIEVSER